jgi:tetratricopeptide (TPR) repeat protein
MHFAVLLDFCMVNGMGLARTSGDARWTSALLEKRAPSFTAKAVDSWRSGWAIPGRENWVTLRGMLTDKEAYKTAWEEVLEGSRDRDVLLSRDVRRERVATQKKKLGSVAPQMSFRELLRQIADNDAKQREEAQAALETESERLESLLGNLLPTAAQQIELSAAARRADDRPRAITHASQAVDLLIDSAAAAQQLLSATGRALIQLARLKMDDALYGAACDDLLAALSYLPVSEVEERTTCIRVYHRAANAALLRAEDFERARAIVDTGVVRGVQPDVFAINVLINHAEDYETAADVFGMIEGTDVRPDVFTYTTLISKTTFENALAIVERMRAANVERNVVTYGTLIRSAADFEQATRASRLMQSDDVGHNAITYTTYLSKAANFRQAFTVLKAMERDAVPPNDHTATTLAGYVRTPKEATQAAKFMNRYGVSGPAFLDCVAASLAANYSAEDVLNWAFEVAPPLGFWYPVDAFSGPIRVYWKTKRFADALRIASAFAHLDASRKVFVARPNEAREYLLGRFHAGIEPHHASYALAKLFAVTGRPGEAAGWARTALGYKNQPRQRVADVEKMLAEIPVTDPSC